MSHRSPVRSPGEVSVADRARVELWTSVLARAWRRDRSAPGRLPSDGWRWRPGPGRRPRAGRPSRCPGWSRSTALVEAGGRAEEEARDLGRPVGGDVDVLPGVGQVVAGVGEPGVPPRSKSGRLNLRAPPGPAMSIRGRSSRSRPAGPCCPGRPPDMGSLVGLQVAVKSGGTGGSASGSPTVPGGQLAEDGTTTRLVEDTSTTPGTPPGSRTARSRPGSRPGRCPGSRSGRGRRPGRRPRPGGARCRPRPR